jgi:hypothetical protein
MDLGARGRVSLGLLGGSLSRRKGLPGFKRGENRSYASSEGCRSYTVHKRDKSPQLGCRLGDWPLSIPRLDLSTMVVEGAVSGTSS